MSGALLHEAGTLGVLYENTDWASSPVGPPETWDDTLRSTLSLVLNTRFPATLFWGPQHVLLYNEAYVDLIADKHPHALGRPTQEIFPEVWDVIGPLIEKVASGGGATWIEDSRLLLHRRGFAEETYFIYSYSPVRNASGDIVGILDISTETTRRVLDRRRLTLITQVTNALADSGDSHSVVPRALEVLERTGQDWESVEIVSPDTAGRTVGADGFFLEDDGDRRVANLALSGLDRDAPRALLRVVISPHLAPDAAYIDFLRSVATAISNALVQAEARENERAHARAVASMSEALQRSLLSEPPVCDGVDIAVRYVPATQEAQVGGDWYDAFVLPDTSLAIAIGDVAGHDQQAAAVMAQMRNLMRGITYAGAATPAAALEQLDGALRDFSVTALATALLAYVENDGGAFTLRWANAGHPPPLIVNPDGTTRYLDAEPDVLLGLVPERERTERTCTLPAGSLVLLFTDGLVERRNADLSHGLQWLADAASAQDDFGADALCDHLLRAVEGHADDDIALLALRIH